MKCAACGAPAAEDSAFCSKCGAKLSPSLAPDEFESPAPKSGDGRCSDPQCLCGDVVIPRGQGYLYVTSDCVEFRRDARSQSDLDEKVEEIERRTKRLQIFGPGTVNPILMCEGGARRRNLNLAVAAEDARRWWETGRVPLRVTPAAGAAAPSRPSRAPETNKPKDPRPDWGCLLSILGGVAGLVIGLAAEVNLPIAIVGGLVGGAVVGLIIMLNRAPLESLQAAPAKRVPREIPRTVVDPPPVLSPHERMYNQGNELMRKGDFKDAVDCFDKALAGDPALYMALNNKGACLIQLRQYAAAIECLTRAAEMAPRGDAIWRNLGWANLSAEKYDEAARAYQKCLDIRPDQFDVWNDMAACHYYGKRLDEAIRCVEQALRLNPNDSKAKANLEYMQKERNQSGS